MITEIITQNGTVTTGYRIKSSLKLAQEKVRKFFFSKRNKFFHQQIRDITSHSLLNRLSLGSHSVLAPSVFVYVKKYAIPGVVLFSECGICVAQFTVIVILSIHHETMSQWPACYRHKFLSIGLFEIVGQVSWCISSLSYNGNNNDLLWLYISFV